MRSFFLPLVLGSLVLWAGAACSDDGDGKSGTGGTGATGGCWPTSDACYVSGPSGPGAECLAKTDNTNKTKWQGRLTGIEVKKPAKLALDFVQKAVIDNGVSLNQPECMESGEGTFSWLFEVDSVTKKMRTGGSPPILDPKAGGCFITMTNLSLPVAPIEVDVTIDGLSFSASGIDVYVPIFLEPDNTTNAIVLPLHEVTINGTFNDDSHNCIGRFKGDELLPEETCAGRAWENGGDLNGYITVQEADQVFMDELGVTLCVWIAGIGDGWKGTAGDCATSPNWLAGQRPKGDWCSTTNAPASGTCEDAWYLEAGFAASAFPVNGDCP
jgi:hypothetical protein